jgi:hypothetical protein
VAPGVPEEPVEPVAPVAPVAPGVPEEPVEPVAPVNVAVPWAPVAPMGPVAPFPPVGPVVPVEPPPTGTSREIIPVTESIYIILFACPTGKFWIEVIFAFPITLVSETDLSVDKFVSEPSLTTFPKLYAIFYNLLFFLFLLFFIYNKSVFPKELPGRM